MTAFRRAAFALVVALVAAGVAPAPANAWESGPCTILVGGVDVAQDGARVEAPAEGNVSYTITSSVPVQSWTMTVLYGPFTIPLLDQAFADNGDLVRHGSAETGAIAKYGTGLYEIRGDARLADGTHCTVGFQMHVSGSLLKSVLGLAAVAMVGAGTVGLIAMLISILLNLNDVRSAVKDFVAHAREARDEGKHAVAARPPDAPPPPGQADHGPPRKP
ncbi:MAG: hypothetical protein V4510_01325 [bacterium]